MQADRVHTCCTAQDLGGGIIVGNEWEELGLAPAASEEYVKVDTAVSLAVTVTNTEDNAKDRDGT